MNFNLHLKQNNLIANWSYLLLTSDTPIILGQHKSLYFNLIKNEKM